VFVWKRTGTGKVKTRAGKVFQHGFCKKTCPLFEKLVTEKRKPCPDRGNKYNNSVGTCVEIGGCSILLTQLPNIVYIERYL
jgi:hypothetical protein